MNATEARSKLLVNLHDMSGVEGGHIRHCIACAVRGGFSNILLDNGPKPSILIPTKTELDRLQSEGYRIDRFPIDPKPTDARRVMISW